MLHSPQARCTETSASFDKTYWLQDLLDLLAAGWPRQLIRSLSRRLSRRSGHGAHCALLAHASSTSVRYAFALGIHTFAPECDARHYTENMSFQGTRWQGIWRGDISPRRSHLIASLDRSDLTTVT